MIEFNKEELLKIAQLSALRLDDKEIELFEKHLQVILNYTEQLQQVEKSEEAQSVRNVNIFREDVAQPSPCVEDILAQAPEREERFFVVPKILD